MGGVGDSKLGKRRFNYRMNNARICDLLLMGCCSRFQIKCGKKQRGTEKQTFDRSSNAGRATNDEQKACSYFC